MIIECPHCGTRFRLDPRQLSDGRSMLKCARCRRVFPAPGSGAAARGRSKSKASDENLSFSFDDDDEWRAPELTSDALTEDALVLNAPDDSDAGGEPAPAPALPRRPRATRPLPGQESLRFDVERDYEQGDAAAEDSEAAARRRWGREAADEDDDAAGFALGEARKTARAEAGKGGISVRSVFVFLAVVVGGYGAMTWSLLDDPDWSRRLTQSLPVIGATIDDSDAAAHVLLRDVQGRYERTRDGKNVFIVTGTAVNNSSESLRGVQIVATLYDGANQRLQDQRAPCGNALEARIRELSVHQVSILRSIKPPPGYAVQPGGRCPFVGIFLDVPPTTASFAAAVAAAQRQT